MYDRVFKIARQEMIKTEGYHLRVYLDSLGKPTVGIGHLVRPEDNLKVGDTITTNRVEGFFRRDIRNAIIHAMNQAEECGEFEDDFVMALTQVNFQLGVNWPKEWPNTYAHLKAGRLQKVIDIVMGSLWHRQTPKRTTAFKMALLKEIKENNRKVVV